ncbi:MAG TPA: CRISPR-associated endonuclease Cas2 [Candidatus Sumerlaeota bacterium]|nr:CRISPR-associated endonuclease Cas2 [Candidatus Sumerlaeota bacterium]
MRNAFIISYDISDPKRLRRVFKLLYGYGEHVQFSVFRCELTPSDRFQLVAKLKHLIHHDQDQVLFIDLGPALGRAEKVITTVGRCYQPISRSPIVV